MNNLPGQSSDTISRNGLLSFAGKYMSFRLAEEDYGLPILTVREIIGMMSINRVPKAASYVRGVINLRGRVIPVVDLRRRFGLPPEEPTEQTVIIVVQRNDGTRELIIGLIVDEVQEVLNIPGDQIVPAPGLEENVNGGTFIRAIGKPEGKLVFLLEPEQIVSIEEQAGSQVAEREELR